MKRISQLFLFLIPMAMTFTACEDKPTGTPSANAGESQIVYEGETVSLDATSSTDAEGFTITYEWTAPANVTLSSTTDASVTFVAPEVTEDTELEFSLSVNNGEFTADTTVSVTVLQSDIAYVLNFGSYDNGMASIDRFNLETGEIKNKYYQAQNSDLNLELTSNIQSACYNDSTFYLMANAADGIIVVDDQLVQTVDAIASDDIVKPRYGVINNDYMYISCWGGDLWLNDEVSYIAKFNLSTQTVDKKIALPGGPEGLAIANGNLYAALNYRDSVAVIDLASDAVSYIVTPAVCSYFLKDGNENLYVSLLSTYSDPSTDAGIGYINTTSNQLEKTYKLDGISNSYSSIFSANSDFSKIYVLGAGPWYQDDAGNWLQDGAVNVLDVANEEFSVFIGGLTAVNGVTVNPTNDEEIYLFGGGSATEAGSFSIYDAEGNLKEEKTSGISPYWTLFLN